MVNNGRLHDAPRASATTQPEEHAHCARDASKDTHNTQLPSCLVERLFKHRLHGSVADAHKRLVMEATRVLDLVDVRLKEPVAATAAERHRRPVDLVVPCIRLEVTAPTHEALPCTPSAQRRGDARHPKGDSPVCASGRRLRAVKATAAAATRLEEGAAIATVRNRAARRVPSRGRLVPRPFHRRHWQPGRKLRVQAGLEQPLVLQREHLERLETQIGASDQLILGSIGVDPKEVHAVLAVEPMRLRTQRCHTHQVRQRHTTGVGRAQPPASPSRCKATVEDCTARRARRAPPLTAACHTCHTKTPTAPTSAWTPRA